MEENKYKRAIKFYLLATKLKYKIRSGWDNKHWNINKERLESIAEHIYGTCILAIAIDSEFDFDMDLNKVLKMLIIHELGETIIGDITPFDNVSSEEKLEKEHKAVIEVVKDLIKKDELISLMIEFDTRDTLESKFAYYCDKLEADIQSKFYLENGNHNSLDNQDNNIIFNNEKVKEMLNNGAENAFDIWYQWDKDIYKDEPIFMEALEYIKAFNITEKKYKK